MEDWIYSALLLYLRDFAETIADGYWHLHDSIAIEDITKAVQDEWKNPKIFHKKPASATIPDEDFVKRVLKKHLSCVRWFRKGEFGQCPICTDLADRRKRGFEDEEERQKYEFDHRLHSKIHQINRRGQGLRLAHVHKSPYFHHAHQFDWYTTLCF